jgi:hypothetical protein
VGGKKPPGDNAVKLLETDAFRSVFGSVSAHLLEGATDSVLTGSTNAGHSSEMITRCKLNIQKYRETIAALEGQAGK